MGEHMCNMYRNRTVSSCRCWVAPTVHLLLKDPVFSTYVAEKVNKSPSSHVQSELLVLAEKFLQHTTAVDVESLLDALAQHTPELLRVDAHGERKAVQEQLDWYEGPGYILEALSAPPAMTADEVPLQACPAVYSLVLRLLIISFCIASLSCLAFGFTLMDILYILHNMFACRICWPLSSSGQHRPCSHVAAPAVDRARG